MNERYKQLWRISDERSGMQELTAEQMEQLQVIVSRYKLFDPANENKLVDDIVKELGVNEHVALQLVRVLLIGSQQALEDCADLLQVGGKQEKQ